MDPAAPDLDPGPPAGLLQCCTVALHLKKVLHSLGLESNIKVSGSKGLHLSVPLNDGETYEATQPFAKAVAQLAQRQMPDLVVSDMAKKLRRGKVLIDWSQNSDFKTTVCVYALRAKREQPFVSLPLTWGEITKALRTASDTALFFTPEQTILRVKKRGDLFAEVLSLKQKLPASFTDALEKAPRQSLSSWQRGRKHGTSLKEYSGKRDHARTPEPAADEPDHAMDASRKVPRFVVQKHQASHLHYDFRLEMQGALRSWAVPKGPPQRVKETRLAMHVEDHPIAYADFEGTIPPGNYGAGTVMVWDHGTYEEASGNPAAAFHAGKLHLTLHGTKLKGEWVLVKDRRDDEGRRWPLIKAGITTHISKTSDATSSKTGRTLAQIARDNDRQWQSNRGA
jgi:bifunctional non-homologous end joining protein LigD